MDREQLYDEVWSEPMIKVAARHGVSSSFLARVCSRLNVPRPARGYWAQIAVGKGPLKPPLPDAQVGDELEWSRGASPPRVMRALPKPPDDETPVARRPRSPRSTRHALIVEARAHFDAAKEKDEYLRPSKRRIVDIFVSRETLDRALDVADILFRTLESAGHRVAFASPGQGLHRQAVDERSEGGRDRDGYGLWGPDRATVVYVGTVAIALTLFELSEEVEVRYVDGEYVRVSELPIPKRRDSYATSWTHKRPMPSGRLCVRAASPYARVKWEKQWRETTKKGELKSKVKEIVQALETEAPTIAKLFEEGERQAEVERREWEAQAERWRREAEERRRVQNIKESREQLFAIIDAWGIATRIEGFFSDIEQRSTSLSGEDREALLDRLRRARSLLGGIDALERFVVWKSPEER